MRLIPLLSLLAILSAASAQASGFILTNTYIVGKEQTVSEEQWVAASTARTEGTFKNDLLISSGAELVLAGTYEGSVWGSSSGTTTFQGSSRRNLRLMGSTIRIEGTIEGNLMAMAYTISISTNAIVSGNALLYANKVIMEGTVGGNLALSALTSTTISGTVRGNAKVSAPEIIVPNDARIQGNLTYTMDRELIPSEHAVGGTLQHIKPENPYSTARIRRQLIWFMAALLTGVPFISLFPMTSAMASLLARKSPLKCLLVGFVAVGALPFFAAVSASTLIGLPLGAVILASWGILFYISRIVMGLMIGTLLLRGNHTSAGRVLVAMVAGLAFIYFLSFLPPPLGGFLGIIQLIVIWTGMGALLLALLQKRRLIIQIPEELKQLEALKSEQNQTKEKPQ